MDSYTTKEFYTDNYLMGRQAVVDTALFPFYALKATQVIKQFTFDNIDDDNTIVDVVQMCCCEVAEYIYKQDNSEHKSEIASEKVDEWSITYVSGQIAEDIKKSTIKGIIYTWLPNTGLLYRGC